ncbi:C40 family peptidase [Sarcina ventriculi]|uniref:Probable endopeptidase p60 n=1 Tax=Sarcina ventriculi TaxID=1267 RepID=A0ABP2APX5_SARVE|nr:C40 family peptidase [Sarcina ventriculi]CUN61071.1 Probable endopeptidase p60 precursor [Sarcina ventriculi]
MKKIFISGVIASYVLFGGCTQAFASTLPNNTATTTKTTKTTKTTSDTYTKVETSTGIVNSPIGLYMLNEPNMNGNIITALDYGANVTIEGVSGDWYKVEAGGYTGYVYKQFITEVATVYSSNNTNSSTSTSTTSTTTSSSEYGVVSNLNLGYSLNFRTAPNLSSTIIGSLTEGTQVKILGESNGWYNVEYNGVVGYAYGEFISITGSSSTSSTTSSSSVTNSTSTSTSSSTSTVTAQDIINYAMQFEGYPYVWGGDSPSTGFDCSGFVQYVYAHFGIDLPRTTFEQVNCGTPVSLSDVKPGDLVFEMPSPEGPNHVGIYIGNGKILDAMDPQNGVTISPIYEVVAVRDVL